MTIAVSFLWSKDDIITK